MIEMFIENLISSPALPIVKRGAGENLKTVL
jgi:hypothetical protein